MKNNKKVLLTYKKGKKKKKATKIAFDRAQMSDLADLKGAIMNMFKGLKEIMLNKGIYDDNVSSQGISIKVNYIFKKSNRNSVGETYHN